MADESFDDEERLVRKAQRIPTEGVRIIGAQEAGELVSRANDGPRWADDDPDGDDAGVADDADLDEADAVGYTGTIRTDYGEVDFDSDDPIDFDEGIVRDEANPEHSFELPHYSDPPTGQVPKVVIGEDSDARWAELADQPRWRDTEHGFDEQTDFTDLVTEEERAELTGEHRALPFDFDEEPPADVIDDEFPPLDDFDDDVADPPPSPQPRPRRHIRIGVDEPPVAAAAGGGLDDLDAPVPPVAQPRRRPQRTVPSGGRAGQGSQPTPRGQRPAQGARSGQRRTARGADDGSGQRNLPLAVGVGIALVVLGAVCFSLGSLATTVLIAVILTLCASEFYKTTTESGYHPAGLVGVVAVAALSIAPLWHGMFAYPVILGLTMLVGLAWYTFVQPASPLMINLGVTMVGVLWVGGLGSFATLTLGVARTIETDRTPNQGIGVIIAAVMVTVCYDVGAYFIGKQFGRTPLSRKSPNKTQEGLFGGVAVGMLVPFLVLWLSKWDPVGVDARTAIAFCLICALMAPVGDLCESAIKRDLDVKDMGTLLPGHGGVLDRFDALLFVLPTAYFMAHLLQIGEPAVF